jgi:hypothetical protein
MKQPLNEQFRRMQKLAGIITEGMSSSATYEGDPVNVVAMYNSIEDAMKGVRNYLARGTGDITFDQWMKGDGRYYMKDLAGSGQIAHIAGMGETAGSQPPMLVDASELEGGNGLNEGMGETVSFDGAEMEVVAKYPNMAAAMKGIAKYLQSNPEMFMQWVTGDGAAAMEEYGTSTPVVHLAGPGEAPGTQPPIIASMDELD